MGLCGDCNCAQTALDELRARRQCRIPQSPMTFDYEIYPDERMIVTRFKGRFTFAGLRDSVTVMWEDPRYSLNYDGIVDISDMSVGIAMADFRAMLDVVRHSAKISRGRWAAVATTPLAAACGMLYQRTVALRHPFEVFSTVEGVCSYLNVQWAGKTDVPRRVKANS